MKQRKEMGAGALRALRALAWRPLLSLNAFNFSLYWWCIIIKLVSNYCCPSANSELIIMNHLEWFELWYSLNEKIITNPRAWDPSIYLNFPCIHLATEVNNCKQLTQVPGIVYQQRLQLNRIKLTLNNNPFGHQTN